MEHRCSFLSMPLKVCKSAAGYYIGRICPECGPYNRRSDYYRTHEEAQEALDNKDYWRGDD